MDEELIVVELATGVEDQDGDDEDESDEEDEDDHELEVNDDDEESEGIVLSVRLLDVAYGFETVPEDIIEVVEEPELP